MSIDGAHVLHTPSKLEMQPESGAAPAIPWHLRSNDLFQGTSTFTYFPEVRNPTTVQVAFLEPNSQTETSKNLFEDDCIPLLL